jgi:hypothetical protein
VLYLAALVVWSCHGLGDQLFEVFCRGRNG